MKTHRTVGDVLYLAVSAAAGLCALVILILGVWVAVGFALADSSADVRRGCAAARGALRDTGLSAVAGRADGIVALHCDTYFRDGDETVICQFRWADDREAVWQAVCDAPGWKIAAIPAEDYAALARTEFWEPNGVVAPASDIVFDAWFYRDDYFEQYGEHAGQAGVYSGLPESLGMSGAPDTLNATFAFYDRETGAFFYHAYDT